MIITDGLLQYQMPGIEGKTMFFGLCNGTIPTPAAVAAWAGTGDKGFSLANGSGAAMLSTLRALAGVNATQLAFVEYKLPINALTFLNGNIKIPLATLQPNSGGLVNTTGTPTWGYCICGNYNKTDINNPYGIGYYYFQFTVGDEFSNAEVMIKNGVLTAGNIFKMNDLTIPFGGSNLLC